jgi:hypothetical protein
MCEAIVTAEFDRLFRCYICCKKQGIDVSYDANQNCLHISGDNTDINLVKLLNPEATFH